MSGAVLVVNAGSTSLKLSIVAPDDDEVPVDSLQVAHGQVVAVGHRLVHGGAHFLEPTILDDAALATLQSLIPLAPRHLPTMRSRRTSATSTASADTVSMGCRCSGRRSECPSLAWWSVIWVADVQ